MKSNIHLSLLDWKKLYRACEESTSDFLLSAINEALSQKKVQAIELEGTKHLSHSALVKIVFHIIQDTNTQEEDGLQIWIDPAGKYKISLNN